MYANLLGQKANRKMSNEDMAKIIGVSRNSYEAKIKSGRSRRKNVSSTSSTSTKPLNFCSRPTKTDGTEVET